MPEGYLGKPVIGLLQVDENEHQLSLVVGGRQEEVCEEQLVVFYMVAQLESSLLLSQLWQWFSLSRQLR